MSLNHVRPWRNIYRRKSRQIHVGPVPVGGDAPISVQTMTNTVTTDVPGTIAQVQAAAEAGADIVKHQEMADPAAVAYDAVEAAKARGADLVLIDTAGRLHTKVNLMDELKKIKRAISKTIPDAPHEVLLILDATTGQNAISQAQLFNDALGVTGLALTKLDGTAKGGIVISICNTLKIPLKYIGIGELIDDLQPFDAAKFVDALI